MNIAIKKERQKRDLGCKDFIGNDVRERDWVAVTVSSGYSAIIRLGQVVKTTPSGGISYKTYNRKKKEFGNKTSCRTGKFIVINEPKDG